MDKADALRVDEKTLRAEDKALLLAIARQTLSAYLSSQELPAFRTDRPELRQPRAVFVTLWRRETDELRGCVGESRARRPLFEAVAQMAVAAAAHDLRFAPVTLGELPHLRIEISALTPLRPIQPHEVVIGQHGLMIVKGVHTGLLLPQVPLEYDWDREEFLRALCHKAGLPDDAWQARDAQLFGFAAEMWGE